MRLRKSAMVVGAILIPLATITLVGGTAFAAKVTGTGSVTCNVGGTATFNPPLSANGSPASKEVVAPVELWILGLLAESLFQGGDERIGFSIDGFPQVISYFRLRWRL